MGSPRWSSVERGSAAVQPCYCHCCGNLLDPAELAAGRWVRCLSCRRPHHRRRQCMPTADCCRLCDDDAEKRETQRLHASVVRFRNKVADLEEKVGELNQQLETEVERLEQSEQVVDLLKNRIDELLQSLTTFGEHQKGCQRRGLSAFMKRDAPGTCGFEQMVAGGGGIEEDNRASSAE